MKLHVNGVSYVKGTKMLSECNRSVTENLRHFVLIFLSHAISWTRPSEFDASVVKIEL